ncbi:penicillin-binding protein [Cellulomonas sp. PSBB021]|nr:penicillin-binding protein [Cellulomonas sp. PSBB021]
MDGGTRRTTVRTARGVAAVGVAALLASAGLTACTASPPGPQDAAQALATALQGGDLADVTLDGATPQQARQQREEAFEQVVDAFGKDALTVTLVSAQEHEDDDAVADAVLRWTWRAGGRAPGGEPTGDADEPDAATTPAGPDGPDGDAVAGAARDWTYETTARLQRDDEDVWHTTWAPALLAPNLAADEQIVVTREAPERADVLGAGDEVLVEARDVYRIGIDKTFLPADEAGAAARGLAAALDLDADAYAARVESAGERAFVEAIVVRADDGYYDVSALRELPGVNAVADSIPLAPTRTFARPILGTVGAATAEIIEKSDGAVQAGDLTGLSGLQRQHEQQLRGTPGLRIEARAVEGSPREGEVRALFTVPPVPGEPLRTTLDSLVQQSAESILADVGPASAIVAIRPSTGEVIAAASGPGGGGMSTATLGQYAPGSTFKVVSALALLRAGMTPNSELTCADGVTVDGRRFDNFPDYPADALGEVPLRTAFAHSCNTAFIGARDEAPQDAVVDAAGSLGLLPAQSLGFASFLGAVPSESDGTDHAATMIGQGRVLASPLGMAVVAASVAAGRTVTPVLVVDGATGAAGGSGSADDADTAADATHDEATSGDEESGSASEEPRPHVDLTADEGAALRALMRGVVTEGGAGFLEDVAGPDVLAKTGTAQFGPVDALKNHVWMIAVQGDLAVAVFVDEGEYGSTTAGPLLTRFLTSPPVVALER